MAKRRRLSGPFDEAPEGPLETKAMPFGRAAPIASVAAEASEMAALHELASEVTRARNEGRIVQGLSLDAIDAGYLVRDRIGVDEAEMESLIGSIRTHGQRMPIEVTDLGQGRYGLISGWRRLTALRRLLNETHEPRFGTVLAILRKPAASGDAYIAMVEENEIRAGLSYYERARIAAKAVEAGVFETEREALQKLYANASRAKRSKIGSFMVLHNAFGAALRFPAAIPERLGLALVKRLEADPRFARETIAGLADAASPEAEAAALALAVAPPKVPASAADEIIAGVRLSGRAGSLRLSGPGVDAAFRARLESWIKEK